MAADDVYLDMTSETLVADAIGLISGVGFCVLRGLMPAGVAAHYRDLTQQALDRPRDADLDRRYKYNAATAASSVQEFDHLGDGALAAPVNMAGCTFVSPSVLFDT